MRVYHLIRENSRGVDNGFRLWGYGFILGSPLATLWAYHAWIDEGVIALVFGFSIVSFFGTLISVSICYMNGAILLRIIKVLRLLEPFGFKVVVKEYHCPEEGHTEMTGVDWSYGYPGGGEETWVVDRPARVEKELQIKRIQATF